MCVTIALLATYDSAAQGKKKGKEPELAISKRGNLIFEDDFEGKELEWKFDAGGEWKIVKKSLTRELDHPSNLGCAFRTFPPVKDAIFELKVHMPPGAYPGVQIDRSARYPGGRLNAGQGGSGSFGMDAVDGNRPYFLAQSPLSYKKPRWVHVIFEMAGTKYALTVDGKTITCDYAAQDERNIQSIYIAPGKTLKGQFLAIDDVKVWEALPKDEEADKDKKKK
ncbi:MAG: hypothetical protein AB1696_29345 [Planctomycetota bacterium]